MRRFMSLLTALPLSLLAASCADFDVEERIEDLRVLAVTTEPAEILYHPFYALLAPSDRPPFLTLPTYDVDVEVFAYDPRGGRILSTTQLCPESEGVCFNFGIEEILEAEPEEGADELRALYEVRKEEVTHEPADERGNPAGRISSLQHSFSFTPAVIDSIIPNTASGQPLPSYFPELPRFVVDVQNLSVTDVPRETAYKRLPVALDVAHPDLPEGFLDTFAQILGVQYCEAVIPDDEFVEGRTDCIEPRGPNENPDLLGFDLDADDELSALEAEGIRFAETSDLGRESLLRVPRGGQVHLTPVFPPGDRQHYQVLGFEVESSELFIENRWEDYVVSWYTTRGGLSKALSDVQTGDRLGVTWQLPSQNIEAGERDTLIGVVRDQRGGTTVGQVVVEYR